MRPKKGLAESIWVIVGLVTVILIIASMVFLLNQHVTINKVLSKYTQLSVAKEVTYRFVSCFSTNIYGILSYDKLEKLNDGKGQECLGYEKNPIEVEVRYLTTDATLKDKRWTYKQPVTGLPLERMGDFRIIIPIKIQGGETESGIVSVSFFQEVIIPAYL